MRKRMRGMRKRMRGIRKRMRGMRKRMRALSTLLARHAVEVEACARGFEEVL
jgi:hypothetical protein